MLFSKENPLVGWPKNIYLCSQEDIGCLADSDQPAAYLGSAKHDLNGAGCIPWNAAVTGECIPWNTAVTGECLPRNTAVTGECIPWNTAVTGEDIPWNTAVSGEDIPWNTAVTGESLLVE